MTDEVASQLKKHIRELWFPSETEAPWKLPTWEIENSVPPELLQVLHRVPQTPIITSSWTDLMARVQQRCQGYGAEGHKVMQQHQALFEFLHQACNRIQVFRVGTVTVDIVVVGEIDDGYVALQTQSVET